MLHYCTTSYRTIFNYITGPEAFPQRVLALIGNHDLYALCDALLEDGASPLMGVPVRDFAYAFTHPEEYLNWVPEADYNDSAAALPALYEALHINYCCYYY